jgi:hypothetical protein
MKLLLCSIPFVLAASALAAPPVDNVGPHLHPNLAAAQRLSTQAFEKIVGGELQVSRTRETIDDCAALKDKLAPELKVALSVQ